MESSKKLNMSAKSDHDDCTKTNEAGLITYMRTDGVQIGNESIEEIRSSISAIYGEKFLPEKIKDYQGNIANAQEAHEAIRPTDPKKTPDLLKNELNHDQFELYTLIMEKNFSQSNGKLEWNENNSLINNQRTKYYISCIRYCNCI